MTTFEQRLCEFCLATSDIKPTGWHGENGWTEVLDEEGTLDRCPTCSFTEDTTPTSPSRPPAAQGQKHEPEGA